MFSSQSQSNIPYCQSSILLKAGLTRHGFFGRSGGISRGSELNTGYCQWDKDENVDRNIAAIGKIFQTPVSAIARLNQIHSDIVVDFIPDRDEIIKADGFKTRKKGTGGLIRTADCNPVIIYSKSHEPTLYTIHAGWRGVANRICEKAVKEILQANNDDGESIFVAVGPAICEECFEIDTDVADIFKKEFGEEHYKKILHRTNGKKQWLNLRKCLQLSFIELGLAKENIDVNKECTVCHNNRYYSFRAEKNSRGSNGTVAILG